MCPSWGVDRRKSRENSPARYRDSRSTHRVCLLPSPILRSTFVNLSNLMPAGHQVVLLCRPRMAGLDLRMWSIYHMRICVSILCKPSSQSSLGMARLYPCRKACIFGTLTTDAQKELGQLVHETCSSPC